jgi:phosphatidate cytidylyltransferase
MALLVFIAVLAMREFFVMYKVRIAIYVPVVVFGSILFYISCRHPAYFVEAVFFTLFFLLFLRMLIGGSPSGSMSDIGPAVVGLVYIPCFLSFHWFIRTDRSGLEYSFLLYSSVWAADSMAYYVGTFLGRNKLLPSVSPNKTVEGVYGSITGGAAGALIIDFVFNIPGLSTIGSITIGAILGVATVIGDLIESMFKRDAGVKDSSSLIPGHGGILDKIDGLLVAGPVLYFIMRYF